MLRLWSSAGSGSSHFDEGIYAPPASGSSRHGLSTWIPTLIAYAPPGFPFLVGVPTSSSGSSDVSAILVSIACRHPDDPGRGLAGLSYLRQRCRGARRGLRRILRGSRRVLAHGPDRRLVPSILGAGARPGPAFPRNARRPQSRARWDWPSDAAQLFKYNGWLAGAASCSPLPLWLAFHPREWRTARTAATWGWGFRGLCRCARSTGPGFAFVESHGGYAAFLAHQRGYLGGIASWPGHLAVQLAQARALSGGAVWHRSPPLSPPPARCVLSGCTSENRDDMSESHLADHVAWHGSLRHLNLAGGFLFSGCRSSLASHKPVVSQSVVMLCTGWSTLSLLTPVLSPYARLWLPLEAFGVSIAGRRFVWDARRLRRRPARPSSRAARWSLGPLARLVFTP